MLISSKDHSFIRAPVILHTISSFNQPTLQKTALPILKGLALCTKNATPLRNEITNTPDFWLTIHSLHANPEAAAGVFSLLENVVITKPSAVTADNYEAAVSLLNDFATAGSIGAVDEQRYEKNIRKLKAVKIARLS